MATDTKLTGGRTNYYLVRVEHPQREDQPPYQAECEDIIRALGMTFDEGCEFKAIWRTAAARKGNGKPGQQAVYDAEKRVHYAQASLLQEQRRQPAKELDVAKLMADLKSEGGTATTITGTMETNPWIEWLGGRQPVDNVPVEYRLRYGHMGVNLANRLSWNWLGGDNLNDIVEYRIIR